MVLKVKGLSKTYPNGKVALQNINLELGKGMFGLLGPNGAGKTTLMRIIALLLEPSEGEVFIFNRNAFNPLNHNFIREELGYLPQDFGILPYLTAYEYLDFFYSFYYSGKLNKKEKSKRIAEMLELVGLYRERKLKTAAFSGGMKRRLGIAQALIHNPKILIIDEPTSGLDPEERVVFRNIISELSHKILVILSTHIIEDIEVTCNDIAIIDEGRIIYRGEPSTLMKDAYGKIFQVEIERDQLDDMQKRYPVTRIISEDEKITLHIISEDGADIGNPVEPSLEEAYLYKMECNKIRY